MPYIISVHPPSFIIQLPFSTRLSDIIPVSPSIYTLDSFITLADIVVRRCPFPPLSIYRATPALATAALVHHRRTAGWTPNSGASPVPTLLRLGRSLGCPHLKSLQAVIGGHHPHHSQYPHPSHHSHHALVDFIVSRSKKQKQSGTRVIDWTS